MDAARSIAEGEVLGGKYLIEGTLGEGAMGKVYAATHQTLAKPVAVKTLHPEIARDPELVGRFEQEARAASAIGHRNIVEVFDLGDHHGLRYMVMERLVGESLGQLLERAPKLSPVRAVAVLDQVLSGLAAAHKRGIVHRDLKPENLFLCRSDDGTITVKILDFGISKVLDLADPVIGGADSAARATKLGFIMGTPLYMSPEQARGQTDIDQRTDIWSAGCVLYEMLCGKTPYDGENYQQILARILQGSYPDPLEAQPGLPPSLAIVVRKALAHNRDDRYPTAAEFRAALTSAQAASTTAVAQPGPPQPGSAAATLPTAKAQTTPANVSSSALSVAAPSAAADDSAFLAALDKFVDATDDRVELSSVAAPAPASAAAPPPPHSTPPQAAAAPKMPGVSTASRGAGAAAKVAANSQAPRQDAFAPPESASRDLELELGVDFAPSSSPSVVRSTARSQVPVELPTRSARGGGLGRAIRGILLLAVIGAGGFAGYRYLTLGYLLSAPQKPARLSVTISPENARTTIDGQPITTAISEVTPDVEHVVRAEAPGRVGKLHRIAIKRGESPNLELRLSTAPLPISAFTLRLRPTKANVTIGVTASEVDAAAAKLVLFRNCIDGLGESVLGAERAYRASTAKGVPSTSAPKGLELNATAVSDCRVAQARGTAVMPSWTVVERQIAEVVDAVQTLEPLVVELADYYNEGRYLDDGAKFAKRKHAGLLAAFSKTREGIESAAAVLANLSEQLSAAELGLVQAASTADPAAATELLVRKALIAARDAMHDGKLREMALLAIDRAIDGVKAAPVWAPVRDALTAFRAVFEDANSDDEALSSGYNAVVTALVSEPR